ncbi:hypothetical protein [Paludibaculum fermentans]|uniref:hypothetical protein n=1 Tax=Paludibaculum fermentans TaxID=1473598 RepID=UPI003EB9DD5D
MKMTAAGCAVLGALLLTGCDREAQEFAAKTAALLKEYESKLSQEIGESEKHYQKFAAVEADSARRRGIEDDAVARREMADKWSADYIERVKQARRVREQLLEVAKVQFEINQKRWLSDLDESRIYLEKLEKLQADKEKVEALGKLLGSLTKKQSLVDQGKEIGKFVEATKEELDKKICADIIAKIKDKETSADRKPALEQLKKDRKCAENN